MASGAGQSIDFARPLCADRIGVARLAKMAVAGIDLRPLWQTLIAKVLDGTIRAGEGLDLSLIAQLLGDKPAGLAIQHEILLSHQLFRSPCAVTKPRLRVLALAAATDMGSNMPIEFLLDKSDIELTTLYVMPRHRHRDRVRLRRLPRCATQDRSSREAVAASAAQSAAACMQSRSRQAASRARRNCRP
jgi:hypothetical protein